jgi:ribosome biogenesis GTPase A
MVQYGMFLCLLLLTGLQLHDTYLQERPLSSMKRVQFPRLAVRSKFQQLKSSELPRYVDDIFVDDVKVPVKESEVAQLPVIAVIGRPNTGKSTLVNRLSGRFKV